MFKISVLKKISFIGMGMMMLNLLLPVSLYAYSYLGYKWPTNAVTVDFSSATIPSSWITPIAQGISPWNATASPFTFSAGVSSNDITVSNSGAGVLALSTITHSGSTISDVDLVFNSYYTWSTSGGAGAYDVRNVATHEFGHFLTLGDLNGGGDTEKTMYYNVATGETKKQTLETDDINGINYIYP